ncbi:MAG: DUF4129 domain-containing protein [Polyangiaceae bacterium]
MKRGWLCLALAASCGWSSLGAAQPVEPTPSASVSPAPLHEVDAKRLEQALERAAAVPEDEFCRKASRLKAPPSTASCAFAEAAQERCPAFRKACAGVKLDSSEQQADWSGVVRIMRAIGYLLLVALIALVAFGIVLLVRRLLDGNATPAAPETPSERAQAPGPVEEAAADRNVQRRFARARELAGLADYPAALAELHAAVVLSLDARGLIEARKGRTNGDYARDLSAQPELCAAFRDVARAVESVQFGARGADSSVFERSLERASSLVGPALVVLVLGLAFGVSGCRGQSAGRGSAASACGTAADGYSFLCAALEETRDARRRYRSLNDLDSKVGVLVIVADSLDDGERASVDSWVSMGGVAVLTRPLPDIDDEVGFNRGGDLCGGSLTFEAAPSAPKLVVGAAPSIRSSELRVYARCDAGIVAGYAPYGDGSVVVLSSPLLLSNASLAAASNAELLLRLIPADSGAVEIVGDWTGHSAESPFASLRAAGLLPWLGHLALLGLAFARYRGTPFARRHPLVEDPRRRFAEHVEALGERWADARASRVALSAYAAWALDALRERTSGSGKANLSELAEALSRRCGVASDSVLRTLAKARLAQDGDEGASEAEHLETLRALSQLIAESGGSRWT